MMGGSLFSRDGICSLLVFLLLRCFAHAEKNGMSIFNTGYGDKRKRGDVLITHAPPVGIRKLFERQPDFLVVRSKNSLLYGQRALKQLLLGAAFVKRSMRLCQTAKPVVSASCKN